MRLLTHNLLMCHVKGCDTNNYPLEIVDAELQPVEAEFNKEFLKNMLYKIDWDALVKTVNELGLDELPSKMPSDDDLDNEEQMKSIHHVLMEIKVDQGRMVCKGCGHVFPIKDGIPNMLLNETEI